MNPALGLGLEISLRKNYTMLLSRVFFRCVGNKAPWLYRVCALLYHKSSFLAGTFSLCGKLFPEPVTLTGRYRLAEEHQISITTPKLLTLVYKGPLQNSLAAFFVLDFVVLRQRNFLIREAYPDRWPPRTM